MDRHAGEHPGSSSARGLGVPVGERRAEHHAGPVRPGGLDPSVEPEGVPDDTVDTREDAGPDRGVDLGGAGGARAHVRRVDPRPLGDQRSQVRPVRRPLVQHVAPGSVPDQRHDQARCAVAPTGGNRARRSAGGLRTKEVETEQAEPRSGRCPPPSRGARGRRRARRSPARTRTSGPRSCSPRDRRAATRSRRSSGPSAGSGSAVRPG